MPKLTKRAVENLAVEAAEYIVFDSEIAGFGLRVFPSGRKSYLIQYRSGGRTRKKTIGAHGVLTPDEARREARRLLGDVARGGNPSEERQREQRAPTVASLCDRFLADYVAHHCKPATERDYRRLVNKVIRPRLGSHKIEDVRRADIVALHHAMRETPYHANRAVAVLSKMFNLAEDWGLRPEGANPAGRIKKFREEEKKRFLSDDERGRLGAVLADCLEDGTALPSVVVALQLLILTGCRLNEILTLRWDYVTATHLELPDSKTGRRRIPLPSVASDLLAALPRDPATPWVIEGEKPGQHLVNLQKPWRRIRARAGLDDVRIHDLRHTYASVAVMAGVDPFRLKEIMGHKNLQTTLRYAHFQDEPVRREADRIASLLSASMRSDKPKLRVVS